MTWSKRIKEYLEFCRYRKELDEKTIKAYRIDLRQFCEAVGEDFFDRQKVDRYITELHKKYKQKTIKRKIASIRAFYAYLDERDIMEGDNPFGKIKVKFKEEKVLPRIIPRNVIEKLLNYMYQLRSQKRIPDKVILRNIAVVEILFATGVRVCEISRLGSDAVDLEAGAIRIQGKGHRERYVQIGNTQVLKIMKQYYEENEKEIKKCGYFFINNRGRKLSEQTIRKMINENARAAGIGLHITPHMFRHSFATYLIEEGADISYVQRILGHSSIKTTQIYIYIAAKMQAEILKTLHPRNKMNVSMAF